MNTVQLNTVSLGDEVIIKKTTSGGGGAAQGSKWLYFDATNPAIEGYLGPVLSFYATYVKMREVDNDWRYIGTVGMVNMLGLEETKNRLLAIGIDMSTKQYGEANTNNRLMSFEEIEAADGESFAEMLKQHGFVEITKEEFYSFETTE